MREFRANLESRADRDTPHEGDEIAAAWTAKTAQTK
jgi:hypothetical protein